MKQYRTNGAIGALLDEYEKAVVELQGLIQTISVTQLTTIADPDTKDPDCRSIQTILTHVIRSGYGYVNYIRKSQGEELGAKKRQLLDSIEEYQKSLDLMFAYNVQLFEDYPEIKMDERDGEKKILTNWGQLFDVDQLMEHAIVHVLRHRRQIERFLLRL